ncbi:MAG: RpiB/LacA/LacB family sugar-phosphate isomerase, partial [Acidimicrobiales bacterium]
DTEVGVCVCGTGIGISIAANKVAGVRAAVVHDVTSARLAKEHNDANVVCLGARLVGPEVAKDALLAYLDARFQEGRHAGRIAKISALEEKAEDKGRDRQGAA